MFGCCVAGRALQTNYEQIDETRIVFQLPSASHINHICVFLLGTIPLPDGYGAAVHLFWPGKGFQFLGLLSNDKPSAIFRLRGAFIPESTASATHSAFSSSHHQASSNVAPNSTDVTAVLGLSVEPLSQIQQQFSALVPAVAAGSNAHAALAGNLNSVDNTALLVQKILKHLVNYVSGYADQGPATMNIIGKWYNVFMGKVQAGGLAFLDHLD